VEQGFLREIRDDRVVDLQQRAVLLQRVVDTGEGPLAVLPAIRYFVKPIRLRLPAILHVLPPRDRARPTPLYLPKGEDGLQRGLGHLAVFLA
jgi:hypothetical protein